jgi:hypothetical protein
MPTQSRGHGTRQFKPDSVLEAFLLFSSLINANTGPRKLRIPCPLSAWNAIDLVRPRNTWNAAGAFEHAAFLTTKLQGSKEIVMSRMLSSAVAVTLSLAITATAMAGGKGGPSRGVSGPSPSHGSKSVSFHDYHVKYGTQFKFGHFYSGREHYHWSKWFWNYKYGCYFYWCPSTCCYYYWYQPSCCYYPVSYIPYATPTVFPTSTANAAAAAAANATNKSNQIVNVVTAPAGQAGNNLAPTSVPLPPVPAGATADATAGPMPLAR